jgi:hypothetical protein
LKDRIKYPGLGQKPESSMSSTPERDMAVTHALLTPLQPLNNLVVNAMHRGGEVLVSEPGSAVANDDIRNRQRS